MVIMPQIQSHQRHQLDCYLDPPGPCVAAMQTTTYHDYLNTCEYQSFDLEKSLEVVEACGPNDLQPSLGRQPQRRSATMFSRSWPHKMATDLPSGSRTWNVGAPMPPSSFTCHPSQISFRHHYFRLNAQKKCQTLVPLHMVLQRQQCRLMRWNLLKTVEFQAWDALHQTVPVRLNYPHTKLVFL